MRRLALALLLAVFFAGPVLADGAAVQTTLYFGLGLKGGGYITETQWQRFVAEVVTPRFPDGLTVIPATGQWRDPKAKQARVMSEPTRIVVIVHPETVAAVRAVGEIKRVYVKRFHQDSVFQTDQPVRIVD
jgi:hypothetical protein